jgi:hypothetical protein
MAVQKSRLADQDQERSMSELIKPLYIATIRGHQLRFFRTPNNDGRPDLPWHCIDDLYHCMGLPRGMRKHFQKQMKSGPFRNDFRTVATLDGIVTIAPHYVAEALSQAGARLAVRTSKMNMHAKARTRAKSSMPVRLLSNCCHG